MNKHERDVFRTPGQARAKRLLADMVAWSHDHAEERATMEKELREIEAKAEQARHCVLAADPVKIIRNAMKAFGGMNAAITDCGDVLVMRADVTFALDDVALAAFVFGFEDCEVIFLPDLTQAEPVT